MTALKALSIKVLGMNYVRDRLIAKFVQGHFLKSNMARKYFLDAAIKWWTTQPVSRRRMTELPYGLSSQCWNMGAYIKMTSSSSPRLAKLKRQLATYKDTLFTVVTDLRAFVRMHHHPGTRQDLRTYIDISGATPPKVVREVRQNFEAAHHLQLQPGIDYHEVVVADFSPPIEGMEPSGAKVSASDGSGGGGGEEGSGEKAAAAVAAATADGLGDDGEDGGEGGGEGAGENGGGAGGESGGDGGRGEGEGAEAGGGKNKAGGGKEKEPKNKAVLLSVEREMKQKAKEEEKAARHRAVLHRKAQERALQRFR